MKFFAESANALASWSGFLEPAVWKGFVILALVFATMALWRRSAAAVRHLAWTMTFVCLLCLPVFVQCLPAWRTPAWILPSGLNNSLPDSLSFVLQNKIRQETKLPPAVSENTVTADVLHKIAPVKYVVTWSDIAIVVWFVGIIIGLARLLAVQIWLERTAGRMRACENQEWLKLIADLRVEYQIRRRVKLLVSETSASPMTWGFLRPIIALPAESREWPDERLRVVLRHELAHVKRWDCLTQEIASVVCALYWFNPLTWLAAGWMRAEREKACDDFVLNAGARPVEYAGHLVEIARQFASENLQGAVAMARPSGLEQRVSAILDGRRNRNRIAKMTIASVFAAIFGLGLLIGSYAAENSAQTWSLENSMVAGQLKAFVAEKESQASAEAKVEGKDVPEEFKSLFAAAANGNCIAVTNFFNDMLKRSPEYANGGHDENMRGPMWQPVMETAGTFELFARGIDKYTAAFGNDIIKSIPAGSVYFGGTDPGRFGVTALQKSHVDGDPFFTLTQNALADRTYLDYLRSMYGGKIYIPTGEDQEKCFQDYMVDAQLRAKENKLKPGEDVKMTAGRVQVGGQVAVMEINGLLVKTIFDKNPDREFYIEESFPLDWMYPNLEPHGLIMKINRQPLTDLSDEIVQNDTDYWTKYVTPIIGDWLKPDTTVKEVVAFAEKIHVKKNLSGFSGDSQFVQNESSSEMFSKLRSSIAGLYAWRAKQAADPGEKKRMNAAADFAFRQSFALCPYSHEAVFRYVDSLLSEGRTADAILVAETAAKMPETQGQADERQFRSLAEQLKSFQNKK